MPNDIPDWSGASIGPAFSPGTFSVAAGTTSTVYSGIVQPGTHALKVYCQSADPTFKAAKVTVTDTTLGLPIEVWNAPVSPNLLVPLDDISVPTVAISVQALAGTASVGSVIFLLSDQAVAVSNDIAGSIPVDIAQLNGAFLVATESGGVYNSFPIRNVGRVRTIQGNALSVAPNSNVNFGNSFTDPLVWGLSANMTAYNCTLSGNQVGVVGSPSGTFFPLLFYATPSATNLLWNEALPVAFQSPIDLGVVLSGDTSYQLQARSGPSGSSVGLALTVYAGSRW